jgi:hypothetical protein
VRRGAPRLLFFILSSSALMLMLNRSSYVPMRFSGNRAVFVVSTKCEHIFRCPRDSESPSSHQTENDLFREERLSAHYKIFYKETTFFFITIDTGATSSDDIIKTRLSVCASIASLQDCHIRLGR